MLRKILLYSFLCKLHSLNGQEYPFSNYKKIFHTKENFEELLFLSNGHYVNLEYIVHLDPLVLKEAKDYYMRADQKRMQEFQNQIAAINNTTQRKVAR